MRVWERGRERERETGEKEERKKFALEEKKKNIKTEAISIVHESHLCVYVCVVTSIVSMWVHFTRFFLLLEK